MNIEIDRNVARALLPPRPSDGHKGTFGHLFVIGGSRGMTGAVIMAAQAAARSGVGLVTAGIPRPLGDIVAANFLVGMTLPLDATPEESIGFDALDKALEFASGKDAVALGPGLSHNTGTRRFAQEFVRRCPAPLLIDADGLNCISGDLDVLLDAACPIVVTPHPGEMSRLTGRPITDIQTNREETAGAFARDTGVIVVLKGSRTVVTDGRAVHVNTSGNSGMATGGSGDVLSGIIGGLLAQGLAAFEAARLGVYVHGLAGDLVARRISQRALIATDLIDSLGEAWLELEGAPHP